MTTRVDKRLARRGGAVELLSLPAALFGAAARLRSSFYDRGWLRVRGIDVPIVSVGNLTVGGTGKTPMVEWLVRNFQTRGLNPGLLSRGYGREAGRELNDEGEQLAESLPGVPHVQDRDRVAGAAELADRGVDVIVLDDGFQHRRLQRDLDLVLIDATRPWGLPPAAQGEAPVRALLPRGFLREPVDALGRAQMIVVTRAAAVDRDALESLLRELEGLAPGVPLAQANHAIRGLRELGGARSEDREHGVDALTGQVVDLVSGIGNPSSFERSVREAGAQIGEHRVFPDHHAFGESDLTGLGSRPIVVTAKDAVKLRGRAQGLWVLEIAFEFTQGRESLEALLDGLPESARRVALRSMHEGLHG